MIVIQIYYFEYLWV